MKELETKTAQTSTGTPRMTGGLSPAPRGSRNGASAEERRAVIAESAYLKSERRGLQGNAEQDWLEAEAEYDALHRGFAPHDAPE